MAKKGPSRSIPTKSLKVSVDASLALKAKVLAEKRKTHASTIVEESLRKYLRARARFLSDIPSSLTAGRSWTKAARPGITKRMENPIKE